MSRQSIPCDQYPGTTWPVKYQWVGDHFGPGASANTGNYATGGYNLSASALGFPGGFEWVDLSTQAQSNNYYAKVFYPANSGNTENRAVTFQSVNVQWFVAGGNNQVANNTDLSAECVRLLAIGI